MKHKPYTNFKVIDDAKAIVLNTTQEPCKTNHTGLEELRQQQMQGRVERPVTNAKTTVVETIPFNEWAENIHYLLTNKTNNENLQHAIQSCNSISQHELLRSSRSNNS